MQFDFRKIFKIALGVLATIFLGAIGSGIWERFLGPALDWLTRISIGAFAWGHSSYRDSIYANAAKGFHEAHSLALYTLVLGLLPVLYFMLLQRHPTSRPQPGSTTPTREFIRSRRGYWFIFLVTAVIFVTVMFSSLRLRHINETITYSLATFEIVRPYVGENSYMQYRSRYFSMRTAEEFDAIHSEIIKVAQDNQLRLPQYQPL